MQALTPIRMTLSSNPDTYSGATFWNSSKWSVVASAVWHIDLQRTVTPQKSGYRFLCCYSFLSRIFPLEYVEWPSESRPSSVSPCLSHASVPVKLPSVNPEPHSNPSSKILELEILPLCLQRSYHFPCSVNPPKISRDPSSSINPRCAKILPSHMQYFSSRINSFLCLSEELNPRKYLSSSKVHENLWRYYLWSYWALTKILAIIK